MFYISEFYPNHDWQGRSTGSQGGIKDLWISISFFLVVATLFVVLRRTQKIELKVYVKKEMFCWWYVWKRSKRLESVFFFSPASDGPIGKIKYYSNSAMQSSRSMQWTMRCTCCVPQRADPASNCFIHFMS